MLFSIAFLLVVFPIVKTRIGIERYFTEKREEFAKFHEDFLAQSEEFFFFVPPLCLFAKFILAGLYKFYSLA
jgi:hypothetical protein